MYKSFTLFELIIVMAIIGILAAISYPLYNNHINKIHYNRAKMALLEMASKLEEQHAINGTYSSTPSSLLNSIPIDLPYRFNTQHISNNAYMLQATPNNQNIIVNPNCPQLTLDNKGNHC